MAWGLNPGWSSQEIWDSLAQPLEDREQWGPDEPQRPSSSFQNLKVGKLNKEAYFLQFRGWEVQEHGERA